MTRTELLETYLKPTDLTVKELIDRNAFSQIMQFAEAHHLEQLRIGGVVESLLCVDSDGLSFITEGETYNLLEESDTLYKISEDDGEEFWYDKKHFVKN